MYIKSVTSALFALIWFSIKPFRFTRRCVFVLSFRSNAVHLWTNAHTFGSARANACAPGLDVTQPGIKHTNYGHARDECLLRRRRYRRSRLDIMSQSALTAGVCILTTC